MNLEILFGVIAVVALSIGCYYSCRVWKMTHSKPVLLMNVAMAYGMVLKLWMLLRAIFPDLPQDSVSRYWVIFYILLAIGVVGIYRGVKNLLECVNHD